MSDFRRSLVEAVFDASPSQTPATWDEPPDHVAADFAAATQSERALSSLMAARDLVLTDPEKLVGKINLSEGTKRMKMSNVFENHILLSRLPPASDILYLFKAGAIFDFRADSPFLFFNALWKLHVGYSRSQYSTLAYSKKDWKAAKRIVSDPGQFGFACEHLSSMWDNIGDLVSEIREAVAQDFNSWSDEEKGARQFSWPKEDKIILSVPPLRISLDATFFDCANSTFRE